MPMPICAVLVVVASLSNQVSSDAAASERAQDHGKTMHNVSIYAARGEYQNAALELKGFIHRWSAAGLDRDRNTIEAELDRMRDLLKKMIEMEELMELADTDENAARRYL